MRKREANRCVAGKLAPAVRLLGCPDRVDDFAALAEGHAAALSDIALPVVESIPQALCPRLVDAHAELSGAIGIRQHQERLMIIAKGGAFQLAQGGVVPLSRRGKVTHADGEQETQ